MNKLVVVLLVGAFGFGATQLPQLTQERAGGRSLNAAQRKELARKRSRSVYKGRGQGESLPKITQTSTGDLYVVGELRYKFVMINRPDLNTLLNEMGCDADAVVVGRVRDKVSHLTEDETSIFTEYQVSVEEVLKNNAVTTIKDHANIKVARIGGAISLNHRNVVFEDKEFKPLTVGDRYLLFLQFVPEKNLYTASDSRGSFLLAGDNLTPLTEEQLPDPLAREKSVSSLIAVVRAAAAGPCDASE